MIAVGRGSRLAVLGSPIAHSRSPQLHRAAYRVLGLDWTFERVEVAAGGLAQFFDELDASWRGFAVTMPLKREVFDHVDHVQRLAERVGAINTVVCGESERWGLNTDVYGAQQALTELGVPAPNSVALLGAGATASSVIAAVANSGARELTIVARSEERALDATTLAKSLGMCVTVTTFDDALPATTDVVVSSLPPSARFDAEGVSRFAPEWLRREVPLLDIAYGSQPSDIHRAWQSVGGHSVTGLPMLLHQAVQQVRIFVTGDPSTPLPAEPEVVAAMRSALVGGF